MNVEIAFVVFSWSTLPIFKLFYFLEEKKCIQFPRKHKVWEKCRAATSIRRFHFEFSRDTAERWKHFEDRLTKSKNKKKKRKTEISVHVKGWCVCAHAKTIYTISFPRTVDFQKTMLHPWGYLEYECCKTWQKQNVMLTFFVLRKITASRDIMYKLVTRALGIVSFFSPLNVVYFFFVSTSVCSWYCECLNCKKKNMRRKEGGGATRNKMRTKTGFGLRNQ